ncbi:Hypothetical predicted protein [Cloeon dipterum]|uniref:Uncharacterized protein n=1 Tax=Cloeon dipterum TaxID=197152 RepID=A0A8S1D6X1_9INSE|nr:Hypothetical predicted protein [Cloeon dipterum]
MRLAWLLLFCLSASRAESALINTTAASHIVSKNFISVTLDPFLISDLPWADPLTVKLCNQLSPAWLKIAPTDDSLDYKLFNLTVFQWAALTHFASESGLVQMWDVGIFERAVLDWDRTLRKGVFPISVAPPTKHAGEMAFSSSAADLPKVQTVKSLMSGYESKNLSVFAPEMNYFASYKDIEQFSSWLVENVDKLNAISMKPSKLIGSGDLSASSVVSKEAGDLFKLELMVLGALEQLGAARKPIAISDARISWEDESALQSFGDTFASTLLWADRLGQAAALGVSTVFQPALIPSHDKGTRLQPSTDFWFAVLHKKLMGERVLAVQSDALGNRSASFFAHCTAAGGHQGVQGAVTVLAVNLGSTPLRGNVSSWSAGRENVTLNQYVLHGDLEGRNVMLNGKTLFVDFESGELPGLEPEIVTSPEEVVLPGHSIVFWVVTDLGAAACVDGQRPKRSTPDEEDDDTETTHLAIVFPVEEVREAERAMQLEPNRSAECECPAGCSPTTSAGCRVGGLRIVKPSCSTAEFLQKMSFILKQRRSGCCCDGAVACRDDDDASNNNNKPVVERVDLTPAPLAITASLEELITTVFTSPPPFWPPGKRTTDENEPSSQPAHRTTSKSVFDPDRETFRTSYLTLVPHTSSRAPSSTTSSPPTTPTETKPQPVFGGKTPPNRPLQPLHPYRFEGQIVGYVHPPHYQTSAFRLQQQQAPLNEPSAVKSRFEQYSNQFRPGGGAKLRSSDQRPKPTISPYLEGLIRYLADHSDDSENNEVAQGHTANKKIQTAINVLKWLIDTSE